MSVFRSVFIALFVGCSAVDDSTNSFLPELDVTQHQRSDWDGTVEGAAAVAFLNDAQTTVALLDDEVRLDRRSAHSLIGNRNGKDGVFGTEDDDLFDSVSEVDAAYWVGPSAISTLVAYAIDNGWLPADDDIIGTWDGVSFTALEAEWTMALVNSASESVLDDEVPLDRRAVDAILEARPVSTVAHLSDLYYVGGAALRHLKDFAFDVDELDWQ